VDPVRVALDNDLRNREYVERNYARLAAEFADQYIAVREGHVLAHAGTIPVLQREIETASLFPESCSSDITVVFVSSKPAAMIL